MNEQLKFISKHMLDLGIGIGALAHANWHSNYISLDNDRWAELSVLQAAHAAEILIKAKIAEEDPLLIFEKLPQSHSMDSDSLEFCHLFEKGRTVQYWDLPDRLWATTGMCIRGMTSNGTKSCATVYHCQFLMILIFWFTLSK